MALNSSTFTDDELLRPFLYNKIHNIPLPNYINILEQDLFGTVKNPWEIWEEFKDSHSYCGKDIYVFSILRKKSATSTRVVRTIGIGAWEGEDTGKSIFAKDTNRLLGIRKRYRFEKSAYEHGGWILHEYSLDKSLITNPSAKNYVLCRFRKNLKRGLQNTETRIYHQPNSHITNCSVVPRKKPRMNNVGQDRSQSKTVAVPPCAAATTTISENNSVWLEENIGQKPRNQLDSENNKTDAVRITNETEREFNKDVECTMNKEDDGDIIINNDNDLIVSKEEGCVTMSWPELFAQELLKKNEGCLIKEEDVPMLSNDFYKDLLFEKYKS
ncbi:NAC domain-containing protein [Trifolium repens]|nr:NAC domain-containing protein [Trifolium repens]